MIKKGVDLTIRGVANGFIVEEAFNARKPAELVSNDSLCVFESMESLLLFIDDHFCDRLYENLASGNGS